jgi:hypothetical protein
MHSQCNPLVEDYTKVFYVIHKGNDQSDQCEMNLRWRKSMREVGGPRFILIGFNVPALSLCLECIETALQLSENITLFEIGSIHKCHRQMNNE